jgi:hypothetical protein
MQLSPSQEGLFLWVLISIHKYNLGDHNAIYQ